MPSDPALRRRTGIALALWLPLLTGALVGRVADRSLLGALLLLTEPLIVGLSLYGTLVLLLRGRTALGLALGLGATAAIALLHLPPTPVPPPATRPDWATGLRACAAFPKPGEGPVRLAQWSLDEGQVPTVDRLAEIGGEADLVVLSGTADATAGQTLARVMGGEARFYPPNDRGEAGMTLVARGSFQPCGADEDSWGLELPAAEGHLARAVVTFPRIEGVGTFPLLALRLDPLHGPSTWAGYPGRLDESGRRIAAVVQAIDASRLVVVGDFGAPPSFRHLAGRLEGAGLDEQALPPTWPARLGPAPALPIHRMDRVWTGRSWQGSAARALSADRGSHAPVMVTLSPELMQAR